MSPLTESTRLTLAKQSVAATDTNIREVSLLLHGNADGGGNILDSSLSPKTISKFGNAASATPPSYPNSNSAFGSAIALDGTGDYLTTNSSAFVSGTEDFTIECWQKLATTNTRYSLIKFGSSAGIQIGGGQFQFFTPSPAVINVAGTPTFTTDWEHIAVVRKSGVISLYHKGILVPADLANGGAANNIVADRLEIGNAFASYTDYSGYIDDLRITKGVARYTSNFTPPTLPFPDF